MSCHRLGMRTLELFQTAHELDINEIMPPHDPVSEADNFAALEACWEDAPNSTPGCEWVDPLGPYC